MTEIGNIMVELKTSESSLETPEIVIEKVLPKFELSNYRDSFLPEDNILESKEVLASRFFSSETVEKVYTYWGQLNKFFLLLNILSAVTKMIIYLDLVDRRFSYLCVPEIIYICFKFLFLNKNIMKNLLVNFDWLFLVFNTTCGAAALAYLYRFDHRLAVVISGMIGFWYSFCFDAALWDPFNRRISMTCVYALFLTASILLFYFGVAPVEDVVFQIPFSQFRISILEFLINRFTLVTIYQFKYCYNGFFFRNSLLMIKERKNILPL